MEGNKFQLKNIYTQEYINENYVPKKSLSKQRIMFSIFSILMLLTGFLLAKGPLSDFSFEGGFGKPPKISYLYYDLSVNITQNPVDIYVIIQNISTSDPIQISQYKIDQITDWIDLVINNETNPNSIIVLNRSLYYDLYNLRNNTIVVKLQNSANISVSKSFNFCL